MSALFSRVALVAALGLVVSLPAVADTVTYTDSFGFRSTNYGGQTGPTGTGPAGYPNGSVTLNLTQFNPGLGRLDSIQITFNGAIQTGKNSTGTIDSQIKNTGGTTANLTLTDTGTLGIYRPNDTTDSALVSIGPVISNTSTGVAAGATVIVNGLTASGGGSTILLTQSDFNLFSGFGTISLWTNASASSVVSSTNGNESHLIFTNADASATVVYTYTITPEPGVSLFLFASSLASLTALRRRRSAQQTKARK